VLGEVFSVKVTQRYLPIIEAGGGLMWNKECRSNAYSMGRAAQIVEASAACAGEIINVLDLASQMTESLADLILCGPAPEAHARLVAHVLTGAQTAFSWKREADVGAQSQYRDVEDR